MYYIKLTGRDNNSCKGKLVDAREVLNAFNILANNPYMKEYYSQIGIYKDGDSLPKRIFIY